MSVLGVEFYQIKMRLIHVIMHFGATLHSGVTYNTENTVMKRCF